MATKHEHAEPEGQENPNAADEADARARREAQLAEYGEYVATENILFGSALAFAKGMPVPKSSVERYGYLEQGLVARASTKAAKEATGATASGK